LELAATSSMPNLSLSRPLKQNKPSEMASTSPANPSANAARSNEQYETTRDGLIIFFGTAKDVSEATDLLAPLKATCALMVRALEMTKVWLLFPYLNHKGLYKFGAS
jgi:hypothetical protein